MRAKNAWALIAFPAAGCAAVALSAFMVFACTQLLSTLLLGDGAQAGQPRYDYVNAHFPDNSVFGFLTGYPQVWVPCLVLLAAAAALGSMRRRVLAVLVLVVAAALPWIPGLSFLDHLMSLPAS